MSKTTKPAANIAEPNRQSRLPPSSQYHYFIPLRPKQQIRYKKLGGTRQSLANDLDQARRIIQLSIQTDYMTHLATIETKKMLHRNRDQLISTLPARRVWLFVKYLRAISEQDPAIPINPFDKPLDSEGGEDAIADSSRVFKYNALARMIFRAASLDIFIKTSPKFGITRGWTQDPELAKRMREELTIMFEKPGSIRNCGIPPKVEEMAEYTFQQQPWQQLPGQPGPVLDALYGNLSNDQVKEILMRTMAEASFEAGVGNTLGQTELRELKRVLFQDLYRLELRSRTGENLDWPRT